MLTIIKEITVASGLPLQNLNAIGFKKLPNKSGPDLLNILFFFELEKTSKRIGTGNYSEILEPKHGFEISTTTCRGFCNEKVDKIKIRKSLRTCSDAAIMYDHCEHKAAGRRDIVVIQNLISKLKKLIATLLKFYGKAASDKSKNNDSEESDAEDSAAALAAEEERERISAQKRKLADESRAINKKISVVEELEEASMGNMEMANGDFGGFDAAAITRCQLNRDCSMKMSADEVESEDEQDMVVYCNEHYDELSSFSKLDLLLGTQAFWPGHDFFIKNKEQKKKQIQDHQGVYLSDYTSWQARELLLKAFTGKQRKRHLDRRNEELDDLETSLKSINNTGLISPENSDSESEESPSIAHSMSENAVMTQPRWLCGALFYHLVSNVMLRFNTLRHELGVL